MKIKSQNLYIFMIYGMLCAYMAGPMLSFLAGVPRIDNPLSMVFVLSTLMIAFFENKRFNSTIAFTLLSLAVMAGWASIHFFISSLTASNYADLTFFITVPCFFYLLQSILLHHPNRLQFIRRLILVMTLFISVPPVFELLAGIPLVKGDEVIALESGVIKGLFFNPNNLGTTALCFAPAVLFFFNLQSRSSKDTLTGWLLFLLLGFIIIISASRTATMLYLLLFLGNLMYRGNALITFIAVFLAAVGLYSVPTEWIKEFLLSLYGNPFLENISSRLYLFLFDLESDNSVSYRQEIYHYFWNHPPLLITGYGPKNFQEYFGGHLSGSLGFNNPHSFIIELYLGFGVISLLGFAGYVAAYTAALISARLDNRQRFFGLFCMVVFLIGGFIPSSILRLPFIWLPCILILIDTVYRFTPAHAPPYRYRPYSAANRQ
ncbi:O-antigen ligase like membrane family protein [Neisseria musculi]|uniref:O-antigen ligase like membrane family protein n=2 Tax=Neisseria musculi TaxID=1815583 RepID=A0A7H1ME63_9NEIS|nr:O-antigen ligase family protein [Neisseria musculi]QNT59928.1 O-antigen ligase like membrane family protein [Neisseria musculi]